MLLRRNPATSIAFAKELKSKHSIMSSLQHGNTHIQYATRHDQHCQKDPYGNALRPYMICIIHVLLTLMREEGGEVHIRDIHKKPSIAHRARQYDTIYKKKSREGSVGDRIHIYVHAIPHSATQVVSYCLLPLFSQLLTLHSALLSVSLLKP